MRERAFTAEDGFGLVELIVAMLVLSIGIAALVGSFASARNLVTVAERESAALHQGEQELERLSATGFAALSARVAQPATVDPTQPGFSISGQTQVVDPVNGIVERAWTDGRLGGRVVPMVTWVDDACCAGTQDFKRVTVAVTVDGAQAPRRPVVLSTAVRP